MKSQLLLIFEQQSKAKQSKTGQQVAVSNLALIHLNYDL